MIRMRIHLLGPGGWILLPEAEKPRSAYTLEELEAMDFAQLDQLWQGLSKIKDKAKVRARSRGLVSAIEETRQLWLTALGAHGAPPEDGRPAVSSL